MRFITKLWATLLLLCVAGVANAATEYVVDQKFTSVAALDGQMFAIVDESPTTPTAMGIGVSGHGSGWDMYFGTITEAYNSNACFYKLEAVQTEGLEGYYYLRTFKNDGTMYTAWGNTENMGFFNSQKADQTVCFALGLNGQNGQDGLNLAVWAIEVSEGKFALKNIGTGLYLHGDNLPAKYEDPFYFTFCTLKEGGEIPDPVIEEPEAPLADGELIPDFFSICAEGAVPYGYNVKFGSEDRAYPNTYGGGARIFAFGEGGDFTRAIYFREGYVQYGNVKKLALEAGKKYIVHFNSAMWQDSGAEMTFLIYKEGDLENAVLTQAIANTPNVHGSKDAVTGSTKSEIEFTPDADGNYILKWDASGWKEVLLANPGVRVAAAAAEPVVINWVAAEQNYENGQEIGTVNFDTSVQAVFDKGTNQNAPKYYTTGAAVRAYGGNTITFSGEKIAITKIELTFASGEGTNEIVADKGSYAEGIWTAGEENTNIVKLTISGTSGHRRIATIKVTYIVDENAEPVEEVHIANTAETAYTVAKAIELIEAGDALSETVFVKGIVSQVDKIQEGAITYWISDDGTTANQFECYKGKGIDGADFASLDDVVVGANVIVTGTMKKYVPSEGDPIYEFNAGNALVSYEAPVKPAIADGTYYFQNVASQKFLAAGDSWGTHAVVNADGLDYIVALTEGKYTLDSKVSNGGNSHFLNGEWNDGAAMGWTIEKTEAGTLTISNGTQFLTAGENSVVTLADDGTAEAAQWIAVTKEERLAALAAATAEAPVNATFIIEDANFGRNDLRKSAWTVTSVGNMSGGNNTNNNAETYHNNFSLSQTLAAAPVGVYALRAQGFYRQDGEDNEHLPVFFANDETQTFPLKTGTENSMSDASNSFSAGNYTIDPIYVQVTEAGNLTVGAKLEGNTNLWCIWDNFQLTYYGADADIDVIKNAAIIQELADLRAKALELKDQVEVEAVKNAIDEALAATADVTGTEAINAAIATVKAVIEKAEVHIAAKIALTGMENVMAGTNVYTAEAFQTYNGIYETAKGKYEAGELTQADAIENPEAQMGWHAANLVDDLLLSAWTIGETQCKDYDAGMYINTWSVEGNSDGSNFKVPFFEYWVADANSLAENTLTATMSNLPEGKYDVTAWVRVRIKNNAETPATGITLSVNEGEAVNVAAGDQVGTSQMYLKEFTATGEVGADGVLKIQFNVAADNNISWLSFKNVMYKKQAVVNPDKDELVAPEGWTSAISNGNLAGDDVTSFVAKESPSTEIVGARIVAGAGENNSRGIVVKSADEAENADAWNTQFWISLNEALPSGAKLHVEFDYRASQAAKATTQAHGAPGAYQHWAAIGDVNFTTEWQHFSADITVDDAMAKGDNGNGTGEGLLSIAFNLAEEKSATEYYFDNFGVWAQKPVIPESWTDLIVNGNMDGEENTCFYVTEQGVGGPFVAKLTAGIGKDGSKAVKVQSADDPDDPTTEETEGTDWDSQFFIRLPYQLPAGTKFKVSFDYKADKAGDFDTQAHANPGQYIHWACCGSGSFTTEWQTYEKEGTVPAECDGSSAQKTFQTIAFNLAKNRVATEFVFDNVKFEVPSDIVSSLTLNPDENPQLYPDDVDGIQTVKVANNGQTIYNLNGQKVNKAQKGLYIINGKKVVVK